MFFEDIFRVPLALSATVAIAACATVPPAQAQSDPNRSTAFEAVLANPGDPNAMLAYARAAVAERDYEAAVSTLERLLDFEPNHSAARYELAVAYFALGSYDLARFHFSLLQQTSSLSEARTAQVADYLQRIEQAGADQSVGGVVTAGTAIADGDATLALGLSLGWSVDMGGPNDNSWETDFLGRLFEGEDAISTGRFLLRTGPRFAVDGFAYGVRLRPYLGLEAVQDDDGDDYVSTLLGVQYLNAHSAEWSSFADLSFGQLDGGSGLSDADTWSAVLGASYTPSRTSRIRFSLRASERDADDPADSRDRLGARIDYTRAGTGLFGDADRRWQVGGYAQFDQLDFDATAREDELSAVGVSMRTFVTDNSFVELAASTTRRDSSDDTRDSTTPVFSVQFGMEF